MLEEEVHELAEALTDDSENLVHIIEEAADVQNYLIAIVHQAVTKYRNRKK
jgi:NTP pyrophosphatase (non-canonical NTP hydrolase)